MWAEKGSERQQLIMQRKQGVVYAAESQEVGGMRLGALMEVSALEEGHLSLKDKKEKKEE